MKALLFDSMDDQKITVIDYAAFHVVILINKILN